MPRPRQSQTKHLIRAYGIKVLKSTHADIQALKRKSYVPSLHGNKVWTSCFSLMNYLKKHPLEHGVRVIDVGCGWGVLSCFLARQFEASVEGVDADADIEPFFELTARVNGVDIQFNNQRFEQLTGKYLGQFDVLVGSDICFWNEMTDPLFNLIRRALKNGVGQVYIADPGRTSFWALAELCAEKFNGEVIGHRIQRPRPSEKKILVVHNEE